VGKSTTAAREAIACGVNVPDNPTRCAVLGFADCAPIDCSGYEYNSTGLLECLGDRSFFSNTGFRLDAFLPCREIVALYDPHCDWDDSALDGVASAILSSNEWSIQFGIEQQDRVSFCFPQLRLVDGTGLAFSWVGGFATNEPDEPYGSGCYNDGFMSHGLIGKESEGLP
jgi:hypothetical protein